MKFVIAAILGSAAAEIQNSVPVQPKLPGWILGNPSGEVEINVFYDVDCPDSLAANEIFKSLLPRDSPVAGKKYSDLIRLRVVPFVLPYHLHAYQQTQMLVYFDDLCSADSTKCYQQQYLELCFSQWQKTLSAKNVSENDFMNSWSKIVADKFGVPQQDLLNLYTKNDTHQSDWRTRETWKYGAQNGVTGTPVAFVNGVRLDNFPDSVEAWISFFKDLFPQNSGMFLH